MISELPGDIGPLDPGVDELFRTLTSEPTSAELADERSALAMFRANISPTASQPTAPIPTAPIPAGPIPAAPNRIGPTRVSRSAAGHARPVTRLFGRSGGWGIRLAAAVVIVLAVGLASAAYTAVLPQPIQLLAHRVLGAIGVPSPPHVGNTSSPPPRRHRSAPPQPGRSSAHASPGPSAPAGTPRPTAHKSAAPTVSPSASRSPSAATGPAALSASASSAVVTAGSQVVISGQFTRSGTGVQGVTVQLIEHLVGDPFWHLAGTAQTTTDGNVAVTVPAVTANAVFRLRDFGVAHSANVLVIADPPVTATLTPGAAGLRDVLMVSTLYAHRGNVVQLEVLESGVWTYLRQRRLNAAGKTAFVLSGKRLQNLEVRVVLLATVRHGGSISNTQTVPPPS
jgi:hypothetical protein